jgi:tetratricopeptide (TPR) repeat protein
MSKRLIGFALLVVALFATLVPGAQADRNQDCIQHADLNLQVQACGEIIAQDGNAAWAYTNRSWALLDKGEFDRSIEDASKAIAINPSMAPAYVNRAAALLGKGENERAIADATQAIARDPTLAMAYVNRAHGYINKTDYDRAIADYDTVLKIDPKVPLAYNGRGWAYRNKGEIDRAITDYDEALRLEPKFVIAYINRSDAYSQKGDYDRVLADATEAIRLDPKAVIAYNNRGLAYKAKGENERAFADFDTAIKLNPKFALAYLNRGFARSTMGDNERALADYDEALRIDPRSTLGYNNRGWAYHLKGDHDRAIVDFTRAIEIDPNMALAYANRGTALSAKGDNDRAVADFRKILELPAATPTDQQRQVIARERIARLVQPTAPPPPTAAKGPRRVALVIGNSKYEFAGALPNPSNDARAVAAVLRRLGFTEVLEHYDLSRDKMGRALRDFGDKAEGAEWAVVFFAGHGLEVNGSSYLVPVDAELKRETHVSDEAISLSQVQAKVDAAGKLGLVILDSCRNNPFLARMIRATTTRSTVSRGLSPVEPEGNVLVAYAAKHGTTAEDGTGKHSPFTEALLANIEEPGLEINFLFRKVRDRVRQATEKRQEPFLYGTLGSEPLYFKAAAR